MTIESLNLTGQWDKAFPQSEGVHHAKVTFHNAPEFLADYHAYYKTPRGYHARSGNSTDGWNATSSLSWMNTNLLQFASEIENPVMVLHG